VRKEREETGNSV